jgi:hypothetical protein
MSKRKYEFRDIFAVAKPTGEKVTFRSNMRRKEFREMMPDYEIKRVLGIK